MAKSWWEEPCMTVGELIESLQEMDHSLPVWIKMGEYIGLLTLELISDKDREMAYGEEFEWPRRVEIGEQ